VTTPRRRQPPTFHPVAVTDISQLTPRMRRITFAGDKLADYPNDGPATHFKLLLPAPGQTEIALPSPGPDGLSWPEPRPVRRTYTPRYVDRAAVIVQGEVHHQLAAGTCSASEAWNAIRSTPAATGSWASTITPTTTPVRTDLPWPAQRVHRAGCNRC
jgi:NADPH-dependent ferric siderophore reductase